MAWCRLTKHTGNTKLQLITDNGFIIPDIKAYIKGFKPGIVNSKAHYNKKQEDIHVADGIITNTGINSKKENISRRFILSVEKAEWLQR